MMNWLQICGLLVMFLSPASVRCQLLQYLPCEREVITPNLIVAKPVKLTGTISTRAGQLIHLNGTTIQVRKPWKNKVLFSAIVDEQGRFDFGVIPAGKFRLVTFWMEGKRVRRLPLFDQPKLMSCSNDNECQLKIELEMHATDEQFEFCPPK